MLRNTAATSMDPTISSCFNLCTGVKVSERSGSIRRMRSRSSTGENTCGPFIGLFAHAQSAFRYMQFVSYVLPT